MRFCFAAIAIAWSLLLGAAPSAIDEVSLYLSLHDTRGAYALIEKLQAESKDLNNDPALLCLLFDY